MLRAAHGGGRRAEKAAAGTQQDSCDQVSAEETRKDNESDASEYSAILKPYYNKNMHNKRLQISSVLWWGRRGVLHLFLKNILAYPLLTSRHILINEIKRILLGIYREGMGAIQIRKNFNRIYILL